MRRSKVSINEEDIDELKRDANIDRNFMNRIRKNFNKLKNTVNFLGSGFAIVVLYYVFLDAKIMDACTIGWLTLAVVTLVLVFDLIRYLFRCINDLIGW